MEFDEENFIEWIGEIPKSWNISKIGELYSFKNIKVNDEDYPPLSVTKNGILPQLESAAKSDAHDDRKLVSKGDFVINSRSDRRGSCGISSLDGSVSLINIVLSPKVTLDSEYYNWLFHTIPFADEFYKWGHGIVDDLWTTNWQNMKNIKIPIPSIEEQKNISYFLNKKCSFIDSVIDDEKNTIEKLKEYKLSLITEIVTKGLDNTIKYKDSNIDWIGEIPVHWVITNLNYSSSDENYSFTDGPFGSDLKNEDHVDEGIPIIQLNNIKPSYHDFTNEHFITEEKYEQLKKHSVKPGDIVIAKMAPVARATIVSDKYEKYVIVADCIKLNCNSSFSNKYVTYSLNSYMYHDAIQKAKGTTRVRINLSELKKIKLLKPPIEEQYNIVNYLDKKCNIIDSFIIKKSQIIDKLEEYKNSLIFEYVTGKKEVIK